MRRLALMLIPVCLAAGGCMQRTITVTSTPPGAVVWLNDVEIGRTPVTTSFLYYGVYDVRLRKEGFEPVVTTRQARAPIYEQMPLDLAAEAIPTGVKTRINWDFALVPNSATPEPALLERAKAFQAEATAPPAQR